MDTPATRYEHRVASGELVRDAAQVEAMEALDEVFSALLEHPPKNRWFGASKRMPVDGLYLWGGVGRGKTYLMDCFFDALPFDNKSRQHFHRFMARVHAARRRYEHKRDPLTLIADDWAADRVLCFDEFHVSDIADAMILSRLTERLFERGVTLVATSNIAPDDLYAGGLKRDRFLPAIERIKTHCRVLKMADGSDYRMTHIEPSATYQTPAGPAADEVLERHFERLATREKTAGGNVEIAGRKVATIRRAASAVWFDFDQLCRTQRSAEDYIALAREFATIMISNVPVMNDDQRDAARRFVNAIDEFYDRRIHLFVTAAAEPGGLYTGTRLSVEFARTASRLNEMRSNDYSGRQHLE